MNVHMPRLPVEVWERIEGHTNARDWAMGAGMACRALQTVQPARLDVSCTHLRCSDDMRQLCMAVAWTGQHWSRAEELRLDLRCSEDTLNAHQQQQWLARALHTYMQTPPPHALRALHVCGVDLSVTHWGGPAQRLVRAVRGWLGCMQRLQLLCIDTLPAPAALPQLLHLRHLSLTQGPLDQVALEAVLAALPEGLRTLQLPFVRQRHVEGGAAPIDLTRFSQLSHVVSASARAELRLPGSCRLHTPFCPLHDLQGTASGASESFAAQQTSAAVGCKWYQDGMVEQELSVLLQRMPRLDTLQLEMRCPGQGRHHAGSDVAHAQPQPDNVLQLPGSFWPGACALSSLTVTLRHFYSVEQGPVEGRLHLTVPVGLQLRELVLHAKQLVLDFEDVRHSAASLDSMRLVYREISGFQENVLEGALAQRGLRLEWCQLSGNLFPDYRRDEPVQYTGMHILDRDGAKPTAFTKVPCVCGACYECALSSLQLQ